jgi:hypothetical protein
MDISSFLELDYSWALLRRTSKKKEKKEEAYVLFTTTWLVLANKVLNKLLLLFMIIIFGQLCYEVKIVINILQFDILIVLAIQV